MVDPPWLVHTVSKRGGVRCSRKGQDVIIWKRLRLVSTLYYARLRVSPSVCRENRTGWPSARASAVRPSFRQPDKEDFLRLGFSLPTRQCQQEHAAGTSAALPWSRRFFRYPLAAFRQSPPPPRIGPSTSIRKYLRSRTTGTAQMEGLGDTDATTQTSCNTPPKPLAQRPSAWKRG